MAESSKSRSPRIVQLTSEAEADLLAIYAYSAQLWGIPQANAYDDFLADTMQHLANNPQIAPHAPNFEIRIFVARWKNARQGHRIFYIETENGISVARILHTAMHWTDFFG